MMDAREILWLALHVQYYMLFFDIKSVVVLWRAQCRKDHSIQVQAKMEE